MKITIISNKYVEELRDEVSKCVEGFVKMYLRLGYTDLVVTVQVKE